MIITNVNLVLENEVVRGSVELRDGVIANMSDSTSQLPGAFDGENGFLMPGLIELHTDNLEKYFTPRPKVNWPPLSAMSAHDTQLIGSGITTVLDAVALGDYRDGNRQENLDQFINTVAESQKRGLTRAEHRIHLRCEVPHSTTVGLFERYVNMPEVQLVSLMDHAPGQRQFVNIDKYRTYYQGKYNMTDAEMAVYEKDQVAQSQRWSKQNRDEITRQCRDLNIPTASHDDATSAHVTESKELGMVIAEFPTTVEAAKRSHELGLKVMMGAPNVIRGGSHSGNVAAHELASLGVLDILSSDYYPVSLLDAVFTLVNDERNNLDVAQAVQLATLNPAQALGLTDRGVIAEGKRADLVLAHRLDDHQLVSRVWREGKKVF
ncbi:carbon-phosphorus lyase complex subunit [Vibrio coralliirubri]|uniref:alpha-D-ribose 1-methylphosphonate 5-triphosphate diphosphatase n=1 Tax=Vibrio TaxID=662 RepID=UPI0006361665|nr:MULTISPECIES: alpha-D-ribose 1-methylphosphonate 5-triphosphate diphosphatase [Vibrio]MCK8072003.1 alpha-D-ribose 1-methylphosphonate 5-triphosphate diphosphatase [Vibrio sp. 1CM23M]MCY9865548.1 alpha-D-ribose 1-methylphosphonate 5-triphosphate diphosphatase [Vibrio coralliirubri]CDT60530.1 carbon-phosphorus lyase complex subunit [Vibrio coralliirubri]CDU03865.1 carbon-phosphorus lyase complex subunit [Vibrio coralliirubri]CDU05234.1 carbon-phosphorus lyase complex subunit [Vibrio coralliir